MNVAKCFISTIVWTSKTSVCWNCLDAKDETKQTNKNVQQTCWNCANVAWEHDETYQKNVWETQFGSYILVENRAWILVEVRQNKSVNRQGEVILHSR